jgi:hypothetical protein
MRTRYISHMDAAAILGVSTRTVTRMVAAGDLVPVAALDTNNRPVSRLIRSEVRALAKTRKQKK